MKKFWKEWQSVGWGLLIAFGLITLAWAGTEDMGGRAYKFDGPITHNNTIDFNGSVYTKYSQLSGTTAQTHTHTVAHGNVLLFDLTGLSGSTLTLPTITSAMDGYMITVKMESGTTDIDITPTAGVDAIESTRGTISGVSDYTIDATGDVGTWMARYRSGSSSYWVYIHKELT